MLHRLKQPFISPLLSSPHHPFSSLPLSFTPFLPPPSLSLHPPSDALPQIVIETSMRHVGDNNELRVGTTDNLQEPHNIGMAPKLCQQLCLS